MTPDFNEKGGKHIQRTAIRKSCLLARCLIGLDLLHNSLLTDNIHFEKVKQIIENLDRQYIHAIQDNIIKTTSLKSKLMTAYFRGPFEGNQESYIIIFLVQEKYNE